MKNAIKFFPKFSTFSFFCGLKFNKSSFDLFFFSQNFVLRKRVSFIFLKI